MGRKTTIHLFPLSQLELNRIEGPHEVKSRLESRLLFGSYPEVVLLESDRERKEFLKELVESYLYRDILQIDGVKQARKMVQLLELLAHQIGKEVSLTELGTQLGMSRHTVDRYLNLLQKCFILTRLGGFSRNLRKEVTRNERYYFYDLGVRNALINNFNLLSRRSDVGELWENYLVMERLKKQSYQGVWSRNYFWRTYDQQEIDWVEDREGQLHAYEFKWSSKKARIPKLWEKSYPEATGEIIDRNNYLNFIT